jgi:hypothetical protein
MRLFAAALLLASMSIVTEAQSLDRAMQIWESLPEDRSPSGLELCAYSLRYGTAITNLRKQGASLGTLLRWAEKEAERSAADLPSEPLLPLGTMLTLTKMIQQSLLNSEAYEQIKGGFPQFAYRSCLKGKPIDE